MAFAQQPPSTQQLRLDSILQKYTALPPSVEKVNALFALKTMPQIPAESLQKVYDELTAARNTWFAQYGNIDEQIILWSFQSSLHFRLQKIGEKGQAQECRKIYETAVQKGASDSVKLRIFLNYMSFNTAGNEDTSALYKDIADLQALVASYKNIPKTLKIEANFDLVRAYLNLSKVPMVLQSLLEINELLKGEPSLYKEYGRQAKQFLVVAYTAIRQFSKAVSPSLEALRLTPKDNARQQIYTLRLCATSYLNVGKLDSTAYYLDASEAFCKQIGQAIHPLHLRTKADYFNQKKDYAQAANLALEAMEGSQESIGHVDFQLGTIYATALNGLKRHKEAVELLENLLKQNANSLLEKSLAYPPLQESYEKMGNYQKANEISKLLITTLSSLAAEDINNATQVVAIQYKITEKDHKIQALAIENRFKQSQNRWLMLGLTLVLLAISFIIYQYRKQQKAKNIITTQANRLNTLLKELHHRVKNNLQVVSSLLSVQSEEVQDEQARHSINEGKLRVDALSIIHQRLYLAEDIAEVNLAEYVKDLLQNLAYVYGYEAKDYKAQVNIHPALYSVDEAIPIGLVLNELFTNAFKYAFPNNPDSMLEIEISQTPTLKICVKDNGKQPPSKLPQGTGFGTKLIESLAYQLNATTQTHFDKGYSFTLTRKVPTS